MFKTPYTARFLSSTTNSSSTAPPPPLSYDKTAPWLQWSPSSRVFFLLKYMGYLDLLAASSARDDAACPDMRSCRNTMRACLRITPKFPLQRRARACFTPNNNKARLKSLWTIRGCGVEGVLVSMAPRRVRWRGRIPRREACAKRHGQPGRRVVSSVHDPVLVERHVDGVVQVRVDAREQRRRPAIPWPSQQGSTVSRSERLAAAAAAAAARGGDTLARRARRPDQARVSALYTKQRAVRFTPRPGRVK